MKLRFVGIVGVIVIVLLTTFGMKASTPATSAPSAPNIGYEIGNTAPDFALKTLEGKSVKLSDFRGKPVYLNFWTSWCPACKEELPEIQKFYGKNKDRVAVLTINITYSDKMKDVQDILKQNNAIFPVLLDEDSTHSVTDRYGVYGIPASFFIDKNGVIRDHHEGAMTLKTLEDSLEFTLGAKG